MTIVGVPTSVTAFIGRTLSGPTDRPVTVGSLADFAREYGGFWAESPLGYAVSHFFLNGGRHALICRVTDDDLPAGLRMLDQADDVNLICIPPLTRTRDVDKSTWDAALSYAEKRRAIVLVDPPSAWATPGAAIDGLASTVTRSSNGAIYYPRFRALDPLLVATETFTPSGAIAGVIARTDATRGFWKAPAGTEATLIGVESLAHPVTNDDSDRLNPVGINCLREFPSAPVVWGGRTLMGADELGSQWKYLPVRRTALHIEESLRRGLQWAASEPNAEPLWSRIRLEVGAFLADLYGKGAFRGTTPRDAYFVKCDGDTTRPADVSRGVVNVVAGFAPLKPAEFVALTVEQRAQLP